MSSSRVRGKNTLARKRAAQDNPMFVHPDLAAYKYRSGFGVWIFGCAITACMTIASLFVGSILGEILVLFNARKLSGFIPSEWLGVLAVIVCIFLLFFASPLLHRICHKLKHVYLRRNGVVAKAQVIGKKWLTLPGRHGYVDGGDQIDLLFLWQQSDKKQTYIYECRYTFLMPLIGEKRALFKKYFSGTDIYVIFHPKRPWYFVAVTPFRPSWFDTLF